MNISRSAVLHTLTAVALLVLFGCSTSPPSPSSSSAVPAQTDAIPPDAPVHEERGIVARNEHFVVYAPDATDTLTDLARRFLGSEERQWEIAEFNGSDRIKPGSIIAISLRALNPRGISAGGLQTVPILCYHRFGARAGKMTVTPEMFAAQLEFLSRNDYRVIRLADLSDFLNGKGALPKRAVVITIDDGHVSSFQIAYPLLKKYRMPATYFLYSDHLNAGDALRSTQIKEMTASGLIDFQAHSKTHSNLAQRLDGESEQRYRQRLDREILHPREVLQQQGTAEVVHYAYPYGDVNEPLLKRLTAAKYRLAVTVNPGGNPFYAHPLMLRRTMVFGDYNIDTFGALLRVFKDMDLR